MFETLPFHLEYYIFTLVPDSLIIGSFIITMVLVAVLWKYKYLILLSEIVFLIICHTLVFRIATTSIEYKFNPFWALLRFTSADPEIFWQTGLNIFMFIPIGLFLCLSFRQLKWWHILSIGLIFSMSIELMQLVLHRGLCESADVICNSAGSLFGYGCVKAFKKEKRW